MLGPANFLSLYAPQHKQPPGFAQRLLQRAKSHSNLSKLTVCTTNNVDDDSDNEHSSDQDDDDDDDSIDGNDDEDTHSGDHQSLSALDSEDDDDDDHYSPAKVVARIKRGTIMNGKGEFVSKGDDDEHSGWLDEARANRKVCME